MIMNALRSTWLVLVCCFVMIFQLSFFFLTNDNNHDHPLRTPFDDGNENTITTTDDFRPIWWDPTDNSTFPTCETQVWIVNQSHDYLENSGAKTKESENTLTSLINWRNMNETTHPWYYYNLQSCLELTKSIGNNNGSKGDQDNNVDVTFFHSYWVGNTFQPQMFLLLQSFLTTANLNHHHFIIWTDRLWCPTTIRKINVICLPLPDNLQLWLHLFPRTLSVRWYQPTQELQSTPMSQKWIEQYGGVRDDRHWSDSDLFRLVILYNYGGVYVDADTILLRDFTPLLSSEWLYKWSFQCTMINGALAHFYKHSFYLQKMFENIVRFPPHGTSWGNDLYEMTKFQYPNLTILPTCFFDPEWMTRHSEWLYQTSDTVYEGGKILLDGPFAIHLHGGIWQVKHFHPDSLYTKLKNQIQHLLFTKLNYNASTV
jgi:Glycosyltransferase sugar-binding region containing DXD motif